MQYALMPDPEFPSPSSREDGDRTETREMTLEGVIRVRSAWYAAELSWSFVLSYIQLIFRIVSNLSFGALLSYISSMQIRAEGVSVRHPVYR
jgi:hypothetical protein